VCLLNRVFSVGLEKDSRDRSFWSSHCFLLCFLTSQLEVGFIRGQLVGGGGGRKRLKFFVLSYSFFYLVCQCLHRDHSIPCMSS